MAGPPAGLAIVAAVLLVAAPLVAAPLLLAGCQAGAGATHSVLGATPYYLDGPQQARPPDGILAAGTAVILVKASGSYALVTLPDGRRAYVAADSLGGPH
jgi:hypothetical protein